MKEIYNNKINITKYIFIMCSSESFIMNRGRNLNKKVELPDIFENRTIFKNSF